MTESLQSVAEIAFRYDDLQRRTVLARRKAGGLCHLSKPFWDESIIVLQVTNPTAGLFAGDQQQMRFHVEEQAHAALTTPSATRFHTMNSGHARITQEFHISHRGCLDYWPEILIPHRLSDFTQSTTIHLAPTASMIFLDQIAPGRVAHAEQFAFRRLETRLDIFEDSRQLVRERCTIAPDKSPWPMQVPEWDTCYYAAIWISDDVAGAAIERLSKQHHPEAHLGSSLLTPRLGVCRILAPSSIILRKILTTIRLQLSTVIHQKLTDFRKV